MKSIFLENPKKTRSWGKELGKKLLPGQIILLYGPLGGGKTTLARAIAEGMGIEDSVTSPTYNLINEYPGNIPLCHMDLYRLSGYQEFEDMGGLEYLDGSAVVLIEWPQRLEDNIPEGCAKIILEPEGEGRRVTWEGFKFELKSI